MLLELYESMSHKPTEVKPQKKKQLMPYHRADEAPKPQVEPHRSFKNTYFIKFKFRELLRNHTFKGSQ
jgi:hypothetical protein